MTFSAGIETKIAAIPKAISPSSDEKSVRPQEPRSRRVAYPYAPVAATKAAVTPAACHSADGSALA